MKLLVAADSYKGTLTSAEVGRILCSAFPACECKVSPLSDGGDGMTEAVFAACGGKKITVTVHDPLGSPVQAVYLLRGKTAVMEMAQASGLLLVEPEKRDALASSTYGTGEMISDALNRGVTEIVLGIGGSATTDGGTGMAEALGVRFTDANNIPLSGCGANLSRIARMDLTQLDPRISETRLIACCDVTNPLYGPQGAAYVYAPQKGANPSEVSLLDAGLQNLASLMIAVLDKNPAELSGAGAAGGLGAGLWAFCNAKLQNGFKTISRLTRLEEAIRNADVVLTGEGCTDAQTARGKLPVGVARLCRKHRKPCFLLPGCIKGDVSELYGQGISGIFPCFPAPQDSLPTHAEAENALFSAARRLSPLLETSESHSGSSVHVGA